MAAVAIPFLLMVSRGLDAQVVTPPSHELRWIVAGDAAADLWFYSLGTLGIDGPGTLPYYDARYARTVAATKARQGVGPSKLDRDAFRLRQAMASDSAFEVLHFLPLYFGRMEPKELPRRLRRTVASTPAAPAADDVTQAVRSALASRTIVRRERSCRTLVGTIVKNPSWRTTVKEPPYERSWRTTVERS